MTSEVRRNPRQPTPFEHLYVARFSLLHVANHHEIDNTSTTSTSSYAASPAAMSNPLAEYLSAIEARDAREKAHEEYINACKRYHSNITAQRLREWCWNNITGMR